jgi:hypothetical protein
MEITLNEGEFDLNVLLRKGGLWLSALDKPPG